MKPDDLIKEQITDASLWAKSFMDTISSKNIEVDKDLMISWFASAIETTKDSTWPGSCISCVSGEEDEYGNIVCSRGCFDPVEPWFYCADFENKYTKKILEKETI